MLYLCRRTIRARQDELDEERVAIQNRWICLGGLPAFIVRGLWLLTGAWSASMDFLRKISILLNKSHSCPHLHEIDQAVPRTCAICVDFVVDGSSLD
jgi:hypothetical protein